MVFLYDMPFLIFRYLISIRISLAFAQLHNILSISIKHGLKLCDMVPLK